MPTNKETIDNMTIRQKISFLAGRQVEGLPNIKAADLEKLNSENANFYPSFKSFANSWDCELLCEISCDLAKQNGDNSCSIVKTPNLGIKTNVYSSGLSEDPCFCEKIAMAFKKGINQSGSMPVLSNCALDNSDAEFLDLQVGKNVIRDYFIKPFESVSSTNGINAIMTFDKSLSGNYDCVNSREVNRILQNKRFISAPIICEVSNAENVAKRLIEGNILLFDGDIKTLNESYEKFLSLQSDYETGSISANEFNSACDDGVVLSEKTINDAALRLLNFAGECEKCSANKSLNVNDKDQLSYRASSESIVLIKNINKTLPLKKKLKVAVVGELAVGKDCNSFVDAISGNKNIPFEYNGYASGYEDLGFKRNDEMLLNAGLLAESSDVVLLFLGFKSNAHATNLQAHSLKLPVYQLALIDALTKTGKTIIGILCGDFPFDMSFDNDLSGVLLLPLNGAYTSDALLQILCGEINPSGKLANSLYDNPDEFFNERKLQKDLKRVKVGAFFGYRYYDTAGVKIKYPFGHGLSYTNFTFSNLKVNYNSAQVSVKNSGNCDGFAVVQFYLGKNNSAVVRPLKELCGFARVELKAGQRKNVKIKLNYSDYAICDEKDGEKIVEKGNYTVFAGTDVLDARLKKVFKVPGVVMSGNNENLSDYISEKSNILNGRYTLGNIQKKKITKQLILFLAAILFTAVYDIIFSLLNFSIIEITVLIILNFLLVPFSVVGIILEINKKIKYDKKISELSLANCENETEINDEPSLEQLFLNEFTEKKETIETTPSVNNEEISDSKTSVILIAQTLEKFMKERGLTLEKAGIRSIISAIFSSRCIFLKSADKSLLTEFISFLTEFFGTSNYKVELSEDFDSIDRLFFCPDENGEKTESALLKAAKDAESGKKKLNFVNLRGVDFPKMEKLLMPVISYAFNPLIENKIVVQDKISKSEVIIPQNLWFILTLGENSNLDNLPSYFAENSFVIDLKLRKTVKKEELSFFNPPLYSQFTSLSGKIENETIDAENIWKKLDAISEYVKSRTFYEIGNKEWRRIENFVFTYFACGGSAEESAERVAHSKLMPKIMPLLKHSDLNESNDFSITLKKILGEDNFKRD